MESHFSYPKWYINEKIRPLLLSSFYTQKRHSTTMKLDPPETTLSHAKLMQRHRTAVSIPCTYSTENMANSLEELTRQSSPQAYLQQVSWCFSANENMMGNTDRQTPSDALEAIKGKRSHRRREAQSHQTLGLWSQSRQTYRWRCPSCLRVSNTQ